MAATIPQSAGKHITRGSQEDRLLFEASAGFRGISTLSPPDFRLLSLLNLEMERGVLDELSVLIGTVFRTMLLQRAQDRQGN